MWPCFGVKLGNSTFCVASAKENGSVEVIANKQGDRVSHAVVFYDGDDEIEIGLTAKQKMIVKPKFTISNSLQLLPEDLSDEKIENALQYISCEFDKSTSRFILPSQEGETKKFEVKDVCTELFKACFELVKHCHPSEVNPSVILSIPHNYPQNCWEILAKAAEDVGFNVAQIITDSTAALMAYELASTTEEECSNGSKFVLCIKCGGLTTQFTLFEISEGVYSVVNSSETFYLGGNKFTNVLVDFIRNEFKKKYHVDPSESHRSMGKIRNAADNCKHILTTLPSTQIYIDSLMDGIDFNSQMTRARFESLIQPVINEFMMILNNYLMEINQQGHKIDEVILAGGTLKIPKLQSSIQSVLPDTCLKVNIPSDEVIAVGCAQQSLYIFDSTSSELRKDVNCSMITSDIHICCSNNMNERKLLIGKGSLLPSQSIVELKEDENVDNDEKDVLLVNIETKENSQQVKIKNPKLVNGVYKIKALIEENDKMPQILLSCI